MHGAKLEDGSVGEEEVLGARSREERGKGGSTTGAQHSSLADTSSDTSHGGKGWPTRHRDYAIPVLGSGVHAKEEA